MMKFPRFDSEDYGILLEEVAFIVIGTTFVALLSMVCVVAVIDCFRWMRTFL